MLNILVCVKQVPDVDLVKMDPVTGNLMREGVPTLLNPLDGNALEAAVRVKERYGGTLTAITMGPPMAEEVLRECLAGGADRAVLVSGRPFGGADTLATSYSLAAAAAALGRFDLIFCGKESLDGATGQMASQLAERFGASQLSCVLTVEDVDAAAGAVRARRQLDGGVETAEALLPCLITVEKANFRPRIPNLRGKLSARKAPVTVLTEKNIPNLDPARIGVPGSGTIVPRIFPPALPEPGQMIDEGGAEADAAALLALLAGRGTI